MGSGVLPLAVATRLPRTPRSEAKYQGSEIGISDRGDLRVARWGRWGEVSGGPAGGWRRVFAAARRRGFGCRGPEVVTPGRGKEEDGFRAISTGWLHGLLRFHLRPIDVVVFHGS